MSIYNHYFALVLETRDLTATGADFSLTTNTVNVPASGMAPATILASDDGNVEPNEEFEISITAMSSTYTVGTPSKATVYIKGTVPEVATAGNTGTVDISDIPIGLDHLHILKHTQSSLVKGCEPQGSLREYECPAVSL